nr:MAG TPA: hypothetical protein [Caudoviricetes sp.]
MGQASFPCPVYAPENSILHLHLRQVKVILKFMISPPFAQILP